MSKLTCANIGEPQLFVISNCIFDKFRNVFVSNKVRGVAPRMFVYLLKNPPVAAAIQIQLKLI